MKKILLLLVIAFGFASCSQAQQTEFNEEALNVIRSIEDDIIVVSVIGKARTGKSYLMNLLLDNVGKNNGVS